MTFLKTRKTNLKHDPRNREREEKKERAEGQAISITSDKIRTKIKNQNKSKNQRITHSIKRLSTSREKSLSVCESGLLCVSVIESRCVQFRTQVILNVEMSVYAGKCSP